MTRLLPVVLALLVTAGCGQSQEPATTAGPAAADTAAAAGTVGAAVSLTAAEGEADTADTRAAQVDLSPVEAAGFIEGTHYLRISPTQPTGSSPDQVEVDEFFMYSCPHCYAFEPYLDAWLENKADYIRFVRVPTTWDAYRRLHAQAYYVADSLGIADEITLPFFQEIHEAGNYLDSPAKLASFFGRFGVASDQFQSLLDSYAILTETNHATELADRYKVDATPTIVINGKYRTLVDMAGSPEKLFELVDLLAAAEAGR